MKTAVTVVMSAVVFGLLALAAFATGPKPLCGEQFKPPYCSPPNNARVK